MEPTIQIIGIKDLDEMEIESVNRISNKYYSKIQRDINNIKTLVVHIKAYKKQGTRRKYAIHIKIIAPTRMFVSTKAMDWNLETSLHKSFESLEKTIQHGLHTDDQHRKTYSKPRS